VILYDSAVSGNCYKVRLLLAHLGVRYERRPVSVVDRSNRAAILGDRNPALRVPVLDFEDGRSLAESNAILFYLADATAYLPGDPFDRAVVLQWLFFEQYDHEPNIAVARFWSCYAEDRDAYTPELPAKHEAGYRALAALEGRLANHPFLVADQYTIADISLYAYTHVAHEGGFVLDRLPATRRWLDRVAAQPGHVRIDD
jgi:glutathione S-transferase